MQIILQKTVSNLGLVGDVVDVAPGYYRNYLAPRNLAFIANPKSIKQLEHQKKIVEAKKAKEKTEAVIIQKKLEETPLKLIHAAGQDDKLFGSITSQEIAIALRNAGFAVDRKYIQVESPIKKLGEYNIEIKIHPEVVANLKVQIEAKKKAVEPKEGEKKAEKKEPARKTSDHKEDVSEKRASGEKKTAVKTSTASRITES